VITAADDLVTVPRQTRAAIHHSAAAAAPGRGRGRVRGRSSPAALQVVLHRCVVYCDRKLVTAGSPVRLLAFEQYSYLPIQPPTLLRGESYLYPHKVATSPPPHTPPALRATCATGPAGPTGPVTRASSPPRRHRRPTPSSHSGPTPMGIRSYLRAPSWGPGVSFEATLQGFFSIQS
jgi:hypothetical protein